MSDYNKINVRFSNFGLNLTHDPTTLPFGKYVILDNVISFFEGTLQSRPGLDRGNATAISAPQNLILGLRRLNNSVASTASYIIRAGTSLYETSSVTPNFTISALASGVFSSTFGSIIVYRPSISSIVWAYIFDRTILLKTDGTNVHPIGYPRPNSETTAAGADFSAALGGAGGNLTASSDYYYRFSLYSSLTGAESLYNLIPDGSITTDITASTNGTNFQIEVTLPDLLLSLLAGEAHAGVDKAKIYRMGGTVATWRYLATVSYTGTTVNYTDNTSDAAILVNDLMDENSDKPFTTTQTDGTDLAGQPLPYACDPYLGYILAVGDPDNPGYLYWTNKFDPDRQDPDNRVEVTSPQDPLQNVFLYNGRPFVFSMEALYELFIGLEPDATFTPSKTSCGRGLFAPLAMCAGPEIYFLSKDGIYATSGGVERSLTDDELRPLFQGTFNAYGAYKSVDYSETAYLRMAYHNNELWFQYRDFADFTHYLIYDVRYKRWRNINFRTDTQAVYSDEASTARLLFGTTDGYVMLHQGTEDEGTTNTIPVQIQSGAETFGTPLINKEFGQVIVDLNPAGVNVTVSVVMNSTYASPVSFSGSSNSATRTKIYIDLNQTVAEDIKIDIQWESATAVPTIYGFEVFYRKDEPTLTFWKVDGVSHGIEGWQILRSAYLSLTADGTILFNVDVVNDDSSLTTYTYTVTPGNDEETKIFVPFDPIKGKVFNYRITLGTATTFRFYPDQSEIHVKPWISAFGYRRANPFAIGEITEDQEGTPKNPNFSGTDEAGRILTST